MVQFFKLCLIVSFCLFSLRLKFVKIDEGILRGKTICYDHFVSYNYWYYKHIHRAQHSF